MEKMSSQAPRSPSVVPLARDQDGNPIELPDGAVGWRIRRQTGGRPRLLLDSKKQPMVFPLDYTLADVEDILAPGSYLLDVVDKGGETLGLTIGVSIGMPRNAEAVDPDSENTALAVVPTTLPSTTSEVRLVLEANVRVTQLAFLHNQRTLELGLRMAETLRDSVQVLASAQADWIKSVSSARGFFRNTGMPLPPVEVKQLTVHTGGDDNEGEGETGESVEVMSTAAATSAHWSAPFVPVVQSVVQQIGPAMMAWATRQQTDGAGSNSNGGGGGSNGNGGSGGSSGTSGASGSGPSARGTGTSAGGSGSSSAGGAGSASGAGNGGGSGGISGSGRGGTGSASGTGNGGGSGGINGSGSSGTGGGKDDRPPWEARDLYDLRDAQQKGVAHREKKEAEKQAAEEQAAKEAAAAKHAEKLGEAIAAAWSPVLGLDVVKLLQLLPKETVSKLMQVQAALSPDEQADAMQILRRHDAEGLLDLMGVFDAASIEESAGFLQRLIADWRTARAAGAKPPTSGGDGGGTGGGGSTAP